MKKLYICEDHPLFRKSLEQLVINADGLSLLGSAGKVDIALRELPIAKPDVVLLDLNLSQDDGFKVLEFVMNSLPETRVVVLTSYDDSVLATKARRAGAAAYILKDTNGEELLDTIRKVELGSFISNVSNTEAVSKFEPDQEFTSILKLTRTEKKVLKHLIRGASVAELAETLFVSENTVKNHKKNIYRKLGVSTQSELILLCQKNGLL